jgi:hypothetical protein
MSKEPDRNPRKYRNDTKSNQERQHVAARVVKNSCVSHWRLLVRSVGLDQRLLQRSDAASNIRFLNEPRWTRWLLRFLHKSPWWWPASPSWSSFILAAYPRALRGGIVEIAIVVAAALVIVAIGHLDH